MWVMTRARARGYHEKMIRRAGGRPCSGGGALVVRSWRAGTALTRREAASKVKVVAKRRCPGCGGPPRRTALVRLGACMVREV